MPHCYDEFKALKTPPTALPGSPSAPNEAAPTISPVALADALASVDYAVLLVAGNPVRRGETVVTYANAAFRALTGYEASDLTHDGWSLLIAEPASRKRFERDTAALMARRNVEGDYLIDRRDGSRFWATVAFCPLAHDSSGWVITVRDYSDARLAHEEVKRSRHRVTAALQVRHEAILTLDLTGRIDFANAAASAKIGRPVAQLRRENLCDVLFLRDSHGSSVVPPLENVLELGQSWERGGGDGFQLETPTSDLVPITVTIAPIVDPQQRITGATVLIADATAATHDSTGEAAGTLLTRSIAHDFNNLLTGLMGTLALARESRGEAQAIRRDELLQTSEKAIQRAQELCRQLASVRGQDAADTSVFGLAGLANECADFIVAGTPCWASTALPSDLWHVQANEARISQVINNLLMNAVEAMPNGGPIEIEGANVRLTYGNNEGLRPGPYVRLRVADVGPGIPAELREKVFEPRFSTKQRNSGLGLAGSRAIAQTSGGGLFLVPSNDGGAAFDLYLPAARPPAPAQEREEPPQLPRGTGRILIMDDERMIRQITCDMLTHLGYDVNAAADGDEAVQHYEDALRDGRPYALVLLDNNVPGGLGGVATLRRLQRIDSEVCAVITSGNHCHPVVAEHRQYGFAAALCKPYNVEQIGRITREALEGSGRL